MPDAFSPVALNRDFDHDRTATQLRQTTRLELLQALTSDPQRLIADLRLV
jgi:hypothetical protein